jgi:hypothetical protein
MANYQTASERVVNRERRITWLVKNVSLWREHRHANFERDSLSESKRFLGNLLKANGLLAHATDLRQLNLRSLVNDALARLPLSDSSRNDGDSSHPELQCPRND